MTTTSSSKLKKQESSLVPEAAYNVYQGVNALSRTFRKTCEGLEVTVDKTIELTSEMLDQQHSRILAEMQESRKQLEA